VARLYANENFPWPVVEALRKLGHDVVTIQETGKAEQRVSDEEVLQLAMADDRAVLTLNRKHLVATAAARIPRLRRLPGVMQIRDSAVGHRDGRWAPG
jgi:predicted nuclease of predicted toxin-antitoxin system